ncbi:MAG: hypothetical protein RML40_07025 [Bacteroidota bacterium]|nr:hypothetical protein [Candidatus Kapabacteria bacterium]MDW8220269.1 hypothetical protein [Bacteroidota bacterium]
MCNLQSLFVVLVLLSTLDYHIVAQVHVLDSLAPKAALSLASTTLYFGEPVQFSADIASEARIPAEEMYYLYKFMGDEAIRARYTVPFVGERIPGYARKVDVMIVQGIAHAPAQANDRVLWTRTFEVQQKAPVIHVDSLRIEDATLIGQKAHGESYCSFIVKGISIDYAQPVDVQNDRVITALRDDIEVGEIELDPKSTVLRLSVQRNNNSSTTTLIAAQNVQVSSAFDAGIFLLNVLVNKLPSTTVKRTVLQGTLGFKLVVKLHNRRAMRSAVAQEIVQIPVALRF